MGNVIRNLQHAKILGPAAVEAWLKHMGGAGEAHREPAVVPPAVSKATDDGMNKTERSFWMRAREAYGDDVYREPFKLRLAGRTWYTIDFLISTEGCRYDCYEIKGFMRDDAAVKLKVAAEQYPCFSFTLVTREKQIWLCRNVTSRGISREVWTPDWLR